MAKSLQKKKVKKKLFAAQKYLYYLLSTATTYFTVNVF